MGDQDEAVDGATATAAPAAPATTSSTLGISQGSLRFNPPKNFNGKEEAEFEPFAYKLRSYLALSNPKFKKAMIHAQEQEDPIDFDLLHEDEQIMAAQLHNMLITLCDGPAARIVQRNDNEFDNGFETWRLLWRRYAPLKRAKATNRITKILNWVFKPNDLETCFNDWEAKINQYDAEQSTPISDDVKIGILISRIQGPLQEHLLLNTGISMKYEDIKHIITNYFKTGQLFRNVRQGGGQGGQSSFGHGGGRGSGQVPTPMEIDAIWRRMKGKGKGRGKSKGGK